jgi:hypothetical protein
MPWGNRSLLFRDPDGNLVNFFTPVSAQAIKNSVSERRKQPGYVPSRRWSRSMRAMMAAYMLSTFSCMWAISSSAFRLT